MVKHQLGKNRNYWMFVETKENSDITRDLGYSLFGLGSKYRRRAQRMQPNDRVLFYVSQLRKWTAIGTIQSKYFEDKSIIWKPETRPMDFRYRVKASPDIVLKEKDFIDGLILGPRLEYLKRWSPEDWPLAFFDRLHLLSQRDFRLIEYEFKRIRDSYRP